MKIGQRQSILDEFYKLEKDIMETKGKEYAGDKDTLDNFKAIAEMLENDSLEVCATYMAKHFLAIMDYVRRGESLSNETFQSRVLDLRVYAMLLFCLVIDKENEKHVGFKPSNIKRICHWFPEKCNECGAKNVCPIYQEGKKDFSINVFKRIYAKWGSTSEEIVKNCLLNKLREISAPCKKCDYRGICPTYVEVDNCLE